jgi:COP9 signalosome complex subunit 1
MEFTSASNNNSSNSNDENNNTLLDLKGSQFDLDKFVEKYSGYTKLVRLHFVGMRCPELRTKAFKKLEATTKSTSNVVFYQKTFRSLDPSLSSQFPYDESWAHSCEQQCKQKLNVLETELVSAMSATIKESIRLSHNDIGNYLYHIGSLQEAMKVYLRSKDSCAVPKHYSDLYMKVDSFAVLGFISRYLILVHSAFIMVHSASSFCSILLHSPPFCFILPVTQISTRFRGDFK